MKLIIVTIIFAAASYLATASALELHSYKDSSATKRDYNQAMVEKVWASETPACIKDGSKLLGVNAAFKRRKFGYRDCSSSEAAKIKQAKGGYKVHVFKLAYLPKPLFDQVVKQ